MFLSAGKLFLECKDDDLPHDQYGDDGLETGAGNEAEEGADCSLEGLTCAFSAVVEFEEECSEERAENHSDRSQDDAGNESYQSTSLGISAAAGQLGEVHRYNVVDDRDNGHDDAPYKKHLHCDLISCCVGAVSPYVKDQQTDPADRSTWKSGQNTAGNADDSGQYCQNRN